MKTNTSSSRFCFHFGGPQNLSKKFGFIFRRKNKEIIEAKAMFNRFVLIFLMGSLHPLRKLQ